MPKTPVLLLTATIEVNGMPWVQRADPAVRLADYRWAIGKWLKDKSISRIVFCENSGYNLSSLIDFCEQNNPLNKEVEFLSFNDNVYPRELGKGYGEMRILDYALKNSQLINNETLLFKITGRLYAAGITQILKNIEKQPSAKVYCNYTGNLDRAETYLFFASVPFLHDYLLPLKEEANDSKGIFFEHLLAKAVHKALYEGARWSVIPGFIDLRGISGTTGTVYTRNLISRIKGRIFYRLKHFVLHRED
jgi:hypothetical protein